MAGTADRRARAQHDLAADTAVRETIRVGRAPPPAPRARSATWRRGGNLLQRTRRPYFYDTASPATSARRAAGAALGGYNRNLAIHGDGARRASRPQPSDMAVAMRVLDASVDTLSADRRGASVRSPLPDFHSAARRNPPDRQCTRTRRTDRCRGQACLSRSPGGMSIARSATGRPMRVCVDFRGGCHPGKDGRDALRVRGAVSLTLTCLH